jgi:hypothetical protein
MAFYVVFFLLKTSCNYSAESGRYNDAVTEKNMHSSNEAIELAYSAIRDRPYVNLPGNISVHFEGQKFRVAIALVSPKELGKARVVRADVDDETGRVSYLSDDNFMPIPPQMLAGLLPENLISAKRAYDIAIGALGGFGNYDKLGPLTVELREGKYYVTFPLIRTPQTGSRSPDFAMQVRIDASNGKVEKVLTAS